MLKRYFVKQGMKEVQIEDFIRKRFPEGNYSHMDLQRTPLGVKVVIWSSTPGRIIGRGGRTINEMTDALREKFKLENPQLEVMSVPKPDLDARIVAKQIALTLERGFNFKRIGNTMLKRVMGSGAIGVEIIISGRVSGGKSMIAKFLDGYLKHSGEQAKTLVDEGFEEVYHIGKSKPGKVGIKVKIMKEFQTITGERIFSLNELKPKRMDLHPDEEEAAKKPNEEKPTGKAEKPAAEKDAKKPAEKPAEKKVKAKKPKAAKTKKEPVVKPAAEETPEKPNADEKGKKLT